MSNIQIVRNQADQSKFNQNASLPFQLRLKDFELALQDVYDFFYDVNVLLASKGLQRLDEYAASGDHVRTPFGHVERKLGETFSNTRAKQVFQWTSGSARSGSVPER